MHSHGIEAVGKSLRVANPCSDPRCLVLQCAVALCMALAVPSASAQLIVGHRGAAADAPENTCAAFRLALKQQADAVEGDFRLTLDNQIVCVHDADLKRVAGSSQQVSDSTLAELKQLDVGFWKHPRFAGERIPTLAEVFAVLPDDRPLLIEIKCGAEIVPVLRRELERLEIAPAQATLISFHPEVIRAVRKDLPEFRALWIIAFRQDEDTGIWEPGLNEVISTARDLEAHGVDVKAVPEVITPQFIAAVQAAGLECHCWTVNEPAWARQLQSWGIDSITTDKPETLRTVIPRQSRTVAPAG